MIISPNRLPGSLALFVAPLAVVRNWMSWPFHRVRLYSLFAVVDGDNPLALQSDDVVVKLGHFVCGPAAIVAGLAGCALWFRSDDVWLLSSWHAAEMLDRMRMSITKKPRRIDRAGLFFECEITFFRVD